VVDTYKELLKKFLGGRTAQNSGLHAKFFQELFERVPLLGWKLLKPLLKCFLGKDKTEARKCSLTSGEDVAPEEEKKIE